jgi:hypothetical protein
MTKLIVYGVVLVVMLASLPVASFGSASETTWVMALALILFGLASAVPPVLRFLPVGDDDGDGDDE